jgi:hypothetical protein
MKLSHALIGAAICAAGSASFASTSTTFSDGADGWKAENGATGFNWISTGGVSGGFVQASDTGGNGLWFFDAPAAYLGNESAAYGGTLSYSIQSSPTAPALVGSYADVQLLGANGVLLAYGGDSLPGTTWTPYSISLVANGSWKIGSTTGQAATEAQMVAVLSDLKDLRIRGDYRQSIETTGLDSVVLTSPVPEPAAWALMLGGLGAVGGLARRRARKLEA